SEDALQVARRNADRLKCHNIVFYQGKWCKALPRQSYDAIVSNPPYISPDDPHLHQGDLRFEPKEALVATEQGLSALRAIITQAKSYLTPGGWLILEHGFDQGKAVREMLSAARYQAISTHCDYAGLERVSCGGT